jgi:hypothetical protein
MNTIFRYPESARHRAEDERVSPRVLTLPLLRERTPSSRPLDQVSFGQRGKPSSASPHRGPVPWLSLFASFCFLSGSAWSAYNQIDDVKSMGPTLCWGLGSLCFLLDTLNKWLRGKS